MVCCLQKPRDLTGTCNSTSWCYLANFLLLRGGQQSCTFCVGQCQDLFTVIRRSQEKAGEFLAVCGRGESYSCRAVVVITPIHHYPSHHESPPDKQPLCLYPSHLENQPVLPGISTWENSGQFYASIFLLNPENSRSLPAERTGTAFQMFCSLPLKIQPEYLN